MPRKYRRPPGARKYKNFSDETLEKALNEIRKGVISLNKASGKYGISAATLSRKLRGKHLNTVGRPTTLSSEDEKCLAEGLILASEWGFPLTQLDMRLIVKGFFDRQGIVERRFQNNMPGVDWVRGFLERNRSILSERLCQNITRSRAAVNPDVITRYFEELKSSLDGVACELIVNYDETNMTDDPQKKKVITRRGCKHPNRIIDSSKSSTSVMFSGSASGVLLPLYVCYRAEHLYDSWTEGGPPGTRYNRSKNGWFNGIIFEDWFYSVALPYFKKFDKQSPKVLIGDNLSSHISLKVINECKENNLRFVLLPPNSTQWCQPLDVAYFRPLKRKWRKVLDEWKTKHRGPVQKDCFPRLLKQCLEELEKNCCSERNLKAGFEAAGIAPLNKDKVLKQLPGDLVPEGSEQSARETSWSASLKDFLEEFKRSETSGIGANLLGPQDTANVKQRKKKRLAVVPGRSVCEEDLQARIDDDQPGPSRVNKKTRKRNISEPQKSEVGYAENSAPQIKSARKIKQKKKVRMICDNSSDEDDPYSIHDSSSDMNFSSSELEPIEEENQAPQEVKLHHDANLTTDSACNQIDLKPNDFILACLKYDKGTKKETLKRFVAQIVRVNGDNYVVKFMRKSSKANNIYIFPQEEDVSSIRANNIECVLKPLFERRGRFCFPLQI